MKKVKEKMLNLLSTFKKSIERFPLTIITILVLTIIYAIIIDSELIDQIIIENITLFGFIFASGTFLIETITEKKIKSRIAYYSISILIAWIFTSIANIKGDFLGIGNAILLERTSRLLICYIISVLILGIYYNYKKSEKAFEEYVTSVFVNISKSGIIYGILAIGILIVTSIFISLILDGEGYTLIGRIEILLFGAYFIPNIIYSFYNTESETTKFSKIVIKYVLGSLLITAFAIIYMYIIKIIISQDMPSNQIFRILAVLFIFGCPIWTMIASFKEEKMIDKTNKLLPILFIPFIILQIYSIGVRIADYGITESRYLCIMLIIFEMIYIIMYLTKKQNIGKVLLVLIALSIISIIVPYANMFKVSQISQYNNLKIYKQKTEYTEKEKEKISGAYYYLKNSTENGEKYINQLLNEEEQKQIKEFRNTNRYDYNYTNMKYIYGNANIKHINIGEYKNLYIVETKGRYSSEKKRIEDVFSNLELIVGDNQNTIYVNILDDINQYIINQRQLSTSFQNMNEIQLDNNKKIILKNISLDYYEDSKEVRNYHLYGYLLEK